MVPHCSITNTYGPAEASIGTIFYEVSDNLEEDIPIGVPINNVKALILDKNIRPVSIGVVGELYLGGVCVGKGYLDDSEKTEKVFLNIDPLGKGKSLYYKTGDLARWDIDGVISYCGRSDTQVKINGVRIELREITKVILMIDDVKDAIVVDGSQVFKKKKAELYAFIIPKYLGHKNILINKVIKYLNEQLPIALQPKVIKVIEEFPLTSNGKINYKLLPIE